jgi:hypothetical protein
MRVMSHAECHLGGKVRMLGAHMARPGDCEGRGEGPLKEQQMAARKGYRSGTCKIGAVAIHMSKNASCAEVRSHSLDSPHGTLLQQGGAG